MSAVRLRPVWREILCDAETPVGAYARLRRSGEGTFLLESVVGGAVWARYSFIGVGARAFLRGRATPRGLRIALDAGPGFDAPALVLEPAASLADSLAAVRAHYASRPEAGLPRFWGGLVGVWGHELVHEFERLRTSPSSTAGDLPVFELVVTDTLVVFDNLSQRVKVVATVCESDDGSDAEAQALRRIDAVIERLRGPAVLEPLELREEVEEAPNPAPEFEHWDYREAVRRAKEHIVAGDVFQLVLSQRFDQPRAGLDPLDVYRTLRVTNPAPYMYLLELASATLAGASPEVLIRVDRDDRRVTVRPIAGTRPRGDTVERDRELERELLEDPKERAEHLMLIDLGRNDVGRVSVAGSVNLEESFSVERYSRVMHIVSEVTGTLLPELDAFDALRAAFPAGTLSGAPKVRALELIAEIEPADRGWYGGAVGYLGYDGGADFAICIRSVVCTDDWLSVQAGAGIVYDSQPEAEDSECHRKASAVLRAIVMARVGRGEADP